MMKLSGPRLLLLASASLSAGCNSEQPTVDPAGQPEPPQATLPVVDPPLNREAVLLAVLQAGSAWASGRADLTDQRQLDGRRFELRLRLDCPGTPPADRNWSFDEVERVLRIEVHPGISAETPLLAELSLPKFEAAEGFWIDRPWLLEPACPAPRAAAGGAMDGPPPTTETTPDAAAPAPIATAPTATGTAPGTAPAPTIGIVQFYTDQDTRSARRKSRGYAATIRLGEDELPITDGYDLVLSGRLTGLPDGRVVACTGPPGGPPSCVVSVRFDQVSLVRPSGEVLAQWSTG